MGRICSANIASVNFIDFTLLSNKKAAFPKLEGDLKRRCTTSIRHARKNMHSLERAFTGAPGRSYCNVHSVSSGMYSFNGIGFLTPPGSSLKTRPQNYFFPSSPNILDNDSTETLSCQAQTYTSITMMLLSSAYSAYGA
jgi:hypothetical protein